jgi:hypothetical protein
MFKSITTKLAGLGTAAALASAIIASPASAGTIANPCIYTGPHIKETTNPIPGEANYIDGSCFPAGDLIDVRFWDSGGTLDTRKYSSTTGTFRVYERYPGYGGQESIVAFDFTAGGNSNMITIYEPW